MSKRFKPFAARVTALLLAGACTPGSDKGPAPQAQRRDSAGIHIVETRAIADAAAQLPGIDTVPRLSIGNTSGDLRYELSYVVGLIRNDDGQIIVADQGIVRLRIYDSTGKFIRDVGGTGDGPGEARSYMTAHKCGTGVIIVRQRDSRAAWWSARGEFISRAKFMLPDSVGRASGFSRGVSPPLYYACSPDGRIIMTGWGNRDKEDARPPLKPGSARTYATWSRLWVLDSAGKVLAELPDTIIAERIEHLSRDGGGGSGPHMFGRKISMALDSNRMFISYGDKPEISIHSSHGKLIEIWRAPDEDRALTGELINRYHTARLSAKDSSDRAYYFPRFELEMPASYPAFDQLYLTNTGYLWARRYRLPWEDMIRYGVFAPDGIFLGYTVIPNKVTVMEIGDGYLLGVVKDSLDVPYAQMFSTRVPDRQGGG